MTLRFGSVCSGIEAASVAWHPLGWKAAWLAEIEKWPAGALAHHYPDVPNLGDMTALPERILSGEVEAPDVFCGGTPCQAFSVAGNRRSLDDARGNLSLTFCEIADAIDYARTTRGEEPAIVFWENVPGVLNTKDNAFGCFLAELAGESVSLEPPGGKWTNAGCVLGPTRAVAWRVFDAQYFGLAQRRQRVFVVASARDGFDPAAVLFESEGVRRDTPPSREARQSVAADVAGGAGDGLARCITTGEAKRQDWETCNILPVCAEISPTEPLCFEPRSPDGHARVIGNISPCLNTMGGGQREPCVVIESLAVSQFGEVAGTLTARHDSSPCADRGMNVVAVTQPPPCVQNSRRLRRRRQGVSRNG